MGARLFHALERFLLALIPKLALLLLRLLGELADQGLVVLAQAFPRLFREHQDLRNDQVSGLGIIFGVAVMLAALVARLVVFRAVADARLHGIDELVEAHGDAVAA